VRDRVRYKKRGSKAVSPISIVEGGVVMVELQIGWETLTLNDNVIYAVFLQKCQCILNWLLSLLFGCA
jgi:hypothetical protein